MNGFHKISASVVLGLTLYATGLSGVAAAQTAGSDDGVRTEVISYADLDLSHPEGQAALNRRVKAAADRVCGPTPERITSPLYGDYTACMQRAQRNALQTVASAQQARRDAKLAQNDPRR